MVDANGRHLHRLSKGWPVYGDFAWAPDGTKFVYSGIAKRGLARLRLALPDERRRNAHPSHCTHRIPRGGLSWQPLTS
jgi:hypothetical protein